VTSPSIADDSKWVQNLGGIGGVFLSHWGGVPVDYGSPVREWTGVLKMDVEDGELRPDGCGKETLKDSDDHLQWEYDGHMVLGRWHGQGVVKYTPDSYEYRKLGREQLEGFFQGNDLTDPQGKGKYKGGISYTGEYKGG
jgi:hypothetical protein